MSRRADLHRTVAELLSSRRLGRPVFVRYLTQGPGDAASLVTELAGILGIVRDWIGQPLDRLYAVGSPADGQVTLTAQFRDGALALVGTAVGPARGDGVDLLILGSLGAVLHDAGDEVEGQDSASADETPDAALITQVEAALTSCGPVRMAEVGGPP